MTESPEQDPVPAQPVSDPPRPAARAPWALVLAALAGLAVGALAIGGVWLGSGTGTPISKRPVVAPPKIGELVSIDRLKLPDTVRPDAVARTKDANERSSQRLSEAHGGAGAVVQVYTDQDLGLQVTLMIYRAPSAHPLYVPFQDPQYIGMAKPSQTAEEFGEVSCVVRNDPTPAGQTPAPHSAHVDTCARTGALLTVEIHPVGDLADDPPRVAALVNSAWNAVA
jgi:hypothetical protein